jgi:glutamate carboxypeptidase
MRFEGDKILGPGVCDMKGGLLVGMYALRALQHAGFDDYEELVFFFNTDEEVGSPVSRVQSAALAQDMDAVFVLESARMNGDVVTARKGSGEFTLRVRGKAAHAGVEPEKGANAVVELAHQITELSRLNGLAPGVTVSPGVIGGGTRSNVVPAEAWLKVDVRAVDPAGQQAIAQAVAEVARHVAVPKCKVEVSGGFNYPPLARTPAVAYLAGLAQQTARDLGFEVGEAATGGGSDANVVAPLGVPVLDGLGPVGGLDHSPDEYIEASSFAPRAALLAGLIERSLAERDRLRKMRRRNGTTDKHG